LTVVDPLLLVVLTQRDVGTGFGVGVKDHPIDPRVLLPVPLVPTVTVEFLMLVTAPAPVVLVRIPRIRTVPGGPQAAIVAGVSAGHASGNDALDAFPVKARPCKVTALITSLADATAGTAAINAMTAVRPHTNRPTREK
jgi:hypothetical protein